MNRVLPAAWMVACGSLLRCCSYGRKLCLLLNWIGALKLASACGFLIPVNRGILLGLKL